MKRITIILLATLTLALLVYTQSRTTLSPLMKAQAAQASRNTLVTPDMWKEYGQLLKSNSGEASVRAWARRNKLEIVSLKGYDFQVIPEQRPTADPGPQELSACDSKKCPTSSGAYPLHNTLGKLVGFQPVKCTASSCKWIYNNDLKSYTRVCGNWKCVSDGVAEPAR